MRIVDRVGPMQRLSRQWRQKGARVALVPTMGYLHAGHVSLMEKARTLVGQTGYVVTSIYVNPTQFGPGEDLARYPRDLKRDVQLCRAAGVDVIFAPSDREMYPGTGAEAFSTFVVEERLSGGMEGASRPTHFKGVTTIVTKLFNIVAPEIAVFGQKDYQQAAVIKRLVRDLNFPVRVVVARTVREKDGLAMSSRNAYLSREERQRATVLWESICRARELVRKQAEGIAAVALNRQLLRMIEQQPETRVDYVAFFDPETLTPVERVKPGTQMALAVRVGRTRLIDNGQL